jgi:hypothetical protein
MGSLPLEGAQTFMSQAVAVLRVVTLLPLQQTLLSYH